MQVLRNKCGALGLAALAVYFMYGTDAVMAQSSDGSRPGDLFSLTQIGQETGQLLKNDGIYLNAGYVNDILADVAGGNKTGATATGDAFFGADFDMNTILGIPRAAIHITFDDRSGKNINTLAGTQFGLSGQNGPSNTVRLSEFSWDQSLLQDHIRLLVGRINPTAEFATSEISCSFLSNIQCAQPFAWYVNDSGAAYPVSTWGGRITFKPSLPSYLRMGVYQDQPFQGNITEHGFNWGTNQSTGVFVPVEAGYQTTFSTARYPVKYDIGAYYDTGSYTAPPAPGETDLNRRGRTAIYGQIEQTVWRPDPATNHSLTLFGGILNATGGYQVYPLSIYAGAYLRGPFESRPNDTFGIQGSFLTINKSARNQVIATYNSLDLTAPNAADEWIFEATYRVAIAPGISIAPDAQFVVHPDEIGFSHPGPGVTNAFIIGAQVAINLGQALGFPHFARTD